jgi:hypothetical protein
VALFKGVIKLTEEQYIELKARGNITTSQGTLSYDENYIYVTDKDENSTNVKIVDSLPEVGVKNTIYMVLKDSSTNTYNRYMYINDRFEIIGDTNLNLSGYAKLTDIPKSLPASDVYDWAKKSEKPSYTMDEIDSSSCSVEVGSNFNIDNLHYSLVRNIGNEVHQVLIFIMDNGTVRISHRDKNINANLDDAYIEMSPNKLKFGVNDILTTNNGYTKEEIESKLNEIKSLINGQ